MSERRRTCGKGAAYAQVDDQIRALIEKTGIPFLPMMTVYDFFIKRALDQLYYNLYWNSSFVLVGTPSGVSVRPATARLGRSCRRSAQSTGLRLSGSTSDPSQSSVP